MKPALLLAVVTGLLLTGCNEPAPDWGPDIENLGEPINSGESEYNAELSPDGLSIMFSSRREGGVGSNDLWMATRPAVDAPWSEPVNLGKGINTPAWETGATLTQDWLELYFTSDRGGGSDRDLYVARRPSADVPFGQPERLPPPINGEHTDSGAYVSEDGLTLVFSSTRPGGLGDRDLYLSTRPSRNAPWGEPRNMGVAINSSESDSSPAMTRDQNHLFFHSRRAPGSEKHDIYVSRRSSADMPWSPAVPLERINTARYHEGTPTVSADGSVLLFRSERAGGYGHNDIWSLRNPLEGVNWPE